jgi:uncharacterized protein YjaZ
MVTGFPDSANIVTSDIDNFWQAFDLLEKQKNYNDSLSMIERVIIDNATEGLKEYMKAANYHEKEFLESLKNNRQKYVTIRSKTENIKTKKDEIINDLRKLKQVYSELKIPSICFSIGKFEVGGTQFKNTLFIGSEKIFEEDVDIAAQCIHEVIHFQQKSQDPTSNLEGAMVEGAAEFICFFVTGKRTIGATWDYGVSNEKKLWDEFYPILDSTVSMNWFLAMPDKEKNRPGALGYFIGYKICEAYYKNTSDKREALKEIIELADPKKIYKQSKYSGN